MAGIEDFVVESLMNEFQQTAQNQLGVPGAPIAGASMGAPITTAVANTSMPGVAAQPQPRYQVPASNAERGAQLYAANRGSAVNPETGLPWGQYADQYEKERVLALNKADAARAVIMQGLQGLDPQIQSSILKRLGIDPGKVQSQVEQQKELATHKASLETPHQQLANQIAMMGLQQKQQQGESELTLKRQQIEGEQAGRGDTRNIQMMRVLAMMAQSSPRMEAAITPILLQMAQQSGINLAPPAKTPATKTQQAAQGAGFKIFRE